MKLYATVPAQWVDPWGFSHDVDMVVQVVEVRRAGKFPHDNGYSVDMSDVYVEDNGATYLAVPPIDFGTSTHYLRRPKSVHLRATWRRRPPVRSIGKDGRPWRE